MSEWINTIRQSEKKLLKKSKQPNWINPMLATLTHDSFSDNDWIFERKLDGERCIVIKKNNKVNLYSRNRKSLNSNYPELLEAFENQPVQDLICDGEIVAFARKNTSFSRLQHRMQVKNIKEAENPVKVYFYVLDIMYLDEYDLRDLPLRTRKSILNNHLQFEGSIRFTPHRNEKGKSFNEKACQKGWEGVIAKKADSKYISSRSGDWLKFKCVNRQEFVIGGYTEPEGQRIGFGALLVGYYHDNQLHYAGKVGTGYDEQTLAHLAKMMRDIEQKKNPFAGEVDEKNIHWIKPELVGEVGFTEWTRDHKLRHPRFLGLRNDKSPQEIIKES